MNVLQKFKVKEVEGEIGIEVEVEGVNLPQRSNIYWTREHDGSLRGQENMEFVLKKPQSRENVAKVLGKLKGEYDTFDTKVNNSYRTSTHVHINVQDFNMVELFNFITSYIILEELLVKYCGEHREGNHFCLRTKDAPFLVHRIVDSIKSGRLYRGFSDDDIRYASMNLVALVKYGSLEFRAMRGTDDFEAIQTWIKMLLKIKDSCKKFRDPKDIIECFSGDSSDAFLYVVMGDMAEQVKGLAPKDYNDILVRGMRYAQDIAYATDWHKFDKKVEREVPKKAEIAWGEPIMPGRRNLVFDKDGFLRRGPEIPIPPKFKIELEEEDGEEDEDWGEDEDDFE